MKMTIQNRLVFITLLSVFALILIAGATVFVSQQSQTRLSFEKLTAIRDVKASQVEEYFGNISTQTITMSENLMVIEAMKEFNREFQALKDTPVEHLNPLREKLSKYLELEFIPRIPKEKRPSDASRLLPRNIASFVLEDRYIISNPNPPGAKDQLVDAGTNGYDTVHAKYHQVFKSYKERFGFADLYLVEPSTGTIIYSVLKQPDYGTELVNGPFTSSGIGKAYQAAVQSPPDTSVLIDFREYIPAYGAPASFIASPIYEGDKLLGVLIFQMPVHRIIQMLSMNGEWASQGMGESGETYLVGPDKLMRSESRPFLESPDEFYRLLNEQGNAPLAQEIATYNTTILHLPVRNQAVNAALDGRTGTVVTENYLGEKVLSAYSFPDIPGVHWAIIAEMEYSEAMESVHKLLILALAIAVGLLILMSVSVALIGRSISGPLDATVTILRDISQGSGDLTVRLHYRRHDELGRLSGYFNTFVAKLNDIVRNIKEKVGQAESLSDSLMASSEESSAAVYQISQNLKSIGEQVSGLEGSVESTFSAVEDIRGTVNKLGSAVNTQTSAMDSSSSAIEEMVASFQSVSSIISTRQNRSSELVNITMQGGEKLDSTRELISEVQQASDKIMEAVTIIQGIADQTNLLAMNAAIEAAHAGDAGRGFSVVADEIRKLSESSRENSLIITESIGTSVDLINRAMIAADETEASFSEVQKEVEDFTRVFSEIAASMTELSLGSTQILDTISTLGEVSRGVSEESGNLNRGAEEIFGSISMVRDVSTSVVGSIAEIDTGIQEITLATQELRELGQSNRDYLQTISHQIEGFTTGEVDSDTDDLTAENDETQSSATENEEIERDASESTVIPGGGNLIDTSPGDAMETADTASGGPDDSGASEPTELDTAE